jgi:DNA-binding transcriptional ArsR family regulator
MVVGYLEPRVDDLFRALSDPTRRDILRRTSVKDLSVSRLAEAYPMSFAAVQKHVAILERSGLVAKMRTGREALVRPVPEAMSQVYRELDQLEAAWRGRAGRMSDLLADGADQNEKGPTG